jgi:hypothetical protein
MVGRRQADDKVFMAGVEEGKTEMRKQVLGFLQVKIMEPGLPRTSDRYKALLDLIAEVSKEAR